MLTLSPSQMRLRPTRAGLMLGLTLVILLGGLALSAHERLGLGHLLSLWLAASTAAAALLSWHNLRGLRLQLRPPRPVHAGQAVALQLQLTSDRPRHGIAVDLQEQAKPSAPTWVDVPAQAGTTVQLNWAAPRRGLHRVPELQVHTLYPLGICRIQARWRPDAHVLVYPAPEAHPPPLPAVMAATAGPHRTRDTSTRDGVRAYRAGDPWASVLWKKAAQSWGAGRDDLLSRDTDGGAHCWLDHSTCDAPTPEARLSRLTAWVLQADRLGLVYGLRLPGSAVAPGRGPAHRARCLEALALC